MYYLQRPLSFSLKIDFVSMQIPLIISVVVLSHVYAVVLVLNPLFVVVPLRVLVALAINDYVSLLYFPYINYLKLQFYLKDFQQKMDHHRYDSHLCSKLLLCWFLLLDYSCLVSPIIGNEVLIIMK